jgi:hypothetical protein
MRQIIPPDPAFQRPAQTQFVAFGFSDQEAEQRCYEYVALNEEPIRTPQHAMNSKVERGSAMFFVCTDVRDDFSCAANRNRRAQCGPSHVAARSFAGVEP